MAAYFIVEVETTDSATMSEYRELSGSTIEKHGGRFIVRGGKTQTLEGGWEPRRIVVIEFESVERANTWYTSAEYQAVLKLRQAAGNSRAILVEGF